MKVFRRVSSVVLKFKFLMYNEAEVSSSSSISSSGTLVGFSSVVGSAVLILNQ